MGYRILLIAAVCSAILLGATLIGAKEAKVIVVDGSGKKKAVRHEPGTRVISLKGQGQSPKTSGSGEDICASVSGRFFCTHVGKPAMESATGENLGEIVGVAWKDSGEPITRYLPEGWLTSESGETIQLNAPAGGEGFYYIIKGQGQLTFMVECSRITAAERQ